MFFMHKIVFFWKQEEITPYSPGEYGYSPGEYAVIYKIQITPYSPGEYAYSPGEYAFIYPKSQKNVTLHDTFRR